MWPFPVLCSASLDTETPSLASHNAVFTRQNHITEPRRHTNTRRSNMGAHKFSPCTPHHCKQIPTKASLPTPPAPSKSNSSIIALNSSSSSPVSPSSLATLFRSSRLIQPFPSASNRSNALSISSLGSRSRILRAASCWKAECGISS